MYMMCRKRATTPQLRTEVPMIARPPNVSNNTASDGASECNPVYRTQESDHYDYIDDNDDGYEKPVTYEQLVENTDQDAQVAPAYDVLGPDYLRIIG